MRQVRRKTADPAARPYLLKAKNEGIKLSWNQFESMLPQDGFGRLGLACFECLLGPCRINPFNRTEERTVCGLNRDELVLKGLYHFLSKHGELSGNVKGMASYEEAQKEAAAVNEIEARNFKWTHSLLSLAERQAARLKTLNDVQKAAKGEKEVTKQMGLGTLKEDYVNICLEEASPAVLDIVENLVKELQEEAVSRGAKGFNVVLAGDLNPYYPFNTVTNQGGVEFALLTGLVDLYAVGKGGLGLGRNVISYYATVYADASVVEGKNEVKNWLIQAAVAYTKRESSKILPSDQLQNARVGVQLDLANLKAHLDQGTYKGICVLGGGSSVKVTEDELLYDTAVKFAAEGVLCLTYGNAAATLGKYGLLDGSSTVNCLGSELDAVKIFDVIRAVGADKMVALFPELSTPRDLQIALSLAIAGVKVSTSIKLPVDGSKMVAEELGQLIEYVEPKELAAKALAKLGY